VVLYVANRYDRICAPTLKEMVSNRATYVHLKRDCGLKDLGCRCIMLTTNCNFA